MKRSCARYDPTGSFVNPIGRQILPALRRQCGLEYGAGTNVPRCGNLQSNRQGRVGAVTTFNLTTFPRVLRQSATLSPRVVNVAAGTVFYLMSPELAQLSRSWVSGGGWIGNMVGSRSNELLGEKSLFNFQGINPANTDKSARSLCWSILEDSSECCHNQLFAYQKVIFDDSGHKAVSQL